MENFNRRDFLILTAGFAVCGCDTPDVSNSSPERVVSAGAASSFAADGVYDRFRDRGFFIIRRGEKLMVLSSYCTHRKCKLEAEKDHTFYCPCHGSTFDSDGRVTEAPARRPLPEFTSQVDANGQLIVTIPAGMPGRP